MRKLLCLFGVFLLFAWPQMGHTQVYRMKASPLQRLEQSVGYTEVRIVYSRPSMKGRTIFGELEAYDEIWRTGANENTLISFSQAVSIQGQSLAAGTYALYTRPGLKVWEVYFYEEIDHWGVPEPFLEEKIALSIKIPAIQLARPVETLTIGLDSVQESSALLAISWEKTYIGIPIDFRTNEVLIQTAKETFEESADDFHKAAVYLRERNLQLEQARTWMEQAMSVRELPDYWDYLEYAKILQQLGETKAAIQAANTSIALAKKSEADNAPTAIAINRETLRTLGVEPLEDK